MTTRIHLVALAVSTIVVIGPAFALHKKSLTTSQSNKNKFTTNTKGNQDHGGIAGQVTSDLTTTRVATGLVNPLYAISPPGDTERLFIVEQRGSDGVSTRGAIRILNLCSGTLNPAPFFTINGITNGFEQGLLGLAFHPDYENNGFFYINYTTFGGGAAGKTIIARYTVSNNPDFTNLSSGTTLLEFDQPQANHNGGWLGFGSDGYLYIATGDGGGSFDTGDGHTEPSGNSQNLNTFLGKILRIDVDGGSPYAIPPDNPFAGAKPGLDEIWAFGVRNPWRPAFDSLTGDLYIADVGQAAFEEINFHPVSGGGSVNYGWRCMEGNQCTGLPGCVCEPPPAPPVTLVRPFHTYDHLGGRCSLTGGFVYRGQRISPLHGTYFFADYCSSQIWSLIYDGTNVTDFKERTAELAPGGGLSIASITSFGEDGRGELYICDQTGGEVFKIISTCPSDLNHDGTTNVNDLLSLIGAWGPCASAGLCNADLTGDCSTDVNDLLAQIGAWGPCP